MPSALSATSQVSIFSSSQTAWRRRQVEGIHRQQHKKAFELVRNMFKVKLVSFSVQSPQLFYCTLHSTYFYILTSNSFWLYLNIFTLIYLRYRMYILNMQHDDIDNLMAIHLNCVIPLCSHFGPGIFPCNSVLTTISTHPKFRIITPFTNQKNLKAYIFFTTPFFSEFL